MQGVDADAVELLSRDRLDGYRERPADTEKVLVGRYLVNAAVADALHPLLHALEVILRNRIDRAVASRHPVDPDLPSGYVDYPSWLDASPCLLTASHRQHVEDAKAKVRRELRRRYGEAAASARRMRTPGRLVAALPFGFWVYLFDPEYSGTRGSPGALWPGLLPDVFPHGRYVPLGEIRKRLRRFLVVRNRVMHHERVHPYAPGKDAAWDPAAMEADALELLGWMSPRPPPWCGTSAASPTSCTRLPGATSAACRGGTDHRPGGRYRDTTSERSGSNVTCT